MSMRFLLAAVTFSLTLAGCSSPSSDDGATPVDPVQFDDGVVKVQTPDTLERLPPAAGERTLSEVPEWRLGEYWTYKMTDGFTGTEYEFTRVVAGVDASRDIYLVGFGAPSEAVSAQGEFPIDFFSNDVLIFHVPGFGDISRADLSYEAHDVAFRPLDFPLEAGKAWEINFEGVGVGEATVGAVSGSTAEISFNSGGYTGTATYDAELGEISHMAIMQGDNSYATYEIVGHGYEYEGLVRVPHDHDLIFIHGRVAGAVNGGAGGGGPVTGPNDEVLIEGIYDRVSFIIAVGGGVFMPSVQGQQVPTAGYFATKVTAPDGTVFEETLTPVDVAMGTSLKISAFGHDAPQGTWTLEHTAGGAGLSFVEGIGYHSIDFDLPSGCVIQSFNAEHHGGQCKIDAEQSGTIDQNGTTQD